MLNLVYFHYHDRSLSLLHKRSIREFIGFIFLTEKKKLHRLDYVFCGDDYLLELNKEYLNHNYYTDIITFSLPEIQKTITGEIYISLDRIKENAKKYDVNMRDEVLRVVFHGALHLCGYRDKSRNQIKIMRAKENKYLLLFKKLNSSSK